MSGLKEVLVAAAEQYGVWGLMLVTFLDSFISPIPPEVIFIPLSLLNPPGALWLAFITTCTSVAGAVVGYCLGHKCGRPLMCRFFAVDKVTRAEKFIGAHGVMAVLLASFTPIPFKIITVSSGLLGMSLVKLVFWSTLGRGARFFLEAAIIMAYGQTAMAFLTGSRFSLLTLGLGMLVLAGYLAWRRGWLPGTNKF